MPNESGPTQERSELQPLMDRVVAQIQKFEAKTVTLRRLTYFVRISPFFLTGVITVVAGWNWGSDDSGVISQNIILVLGAFSTFLASLAAFWNVERQWFQSIAIGRKLQQLRERIRRFEYRAEPLSAKKIDQLWMAYDRILEERVQQWEGILTQSSDTSSHD